MTIEILHQKYLVASVSLVLMCSSARVAISARSEGEQVVVAAIGLDSATASGHISPAGVVSAFSLRLC